MASNYPGDYDSFPSVNGATDRLDNPSHAGLHNLMADALVATQTELGKNPSGSSATVAARLDTLIPKSEAIKFHSYSTAGEARPTGYACIYWVWAGSGSPVEPTNASAHDLGFW